MPLNAGKIKAPQGSGVQQEPLEPGNYLARLVQVIDLGLQPQQPYQGQDKPPAYEVMLTYELGTEFILDEDGNPVEDKPRWISETMPLHSLDSDLAKSTKRIKTLDPKLESGGDLTKLVNSPCTVTVVTRPSKKDPAKIYMNVGNVTPPMKGVPVPELVNPPKVFDLGDPDMEIFGSLPEWLQEKVKSNLEYQGSILQQKLEGEASEPAPAVEEGEDVDNPY